MKCLFPTIITNIRHFNLSENHHNLFITWRQKQRNHKTKQFIGRIWKSVCTLDMFWCLLVSNQEYIRPPGWNSPSESARMISEYLQSGHLWKGWHRMAWRWRFEAAGRNHFYFLLLCSLKDRWLARRRKDVLILILL